MTKTENKLTEEEAIRLGVQKGFKAGYQKSQEDVLKIIDDFLNFDEKYINPRIILYKIEWEELKNKIINHSQHSVRDGSSPKGTSDKCSNELTSRKDTSADTQTHELLGFRLSEEDKKRFKGKKLKPNQAVKLFEEKQKEDKK